MARPKGSKTQKYPPLHVRQVPAVGRVCGSEELTPVNGYETATTEGGGTLSDGFEYVRIERRLHECGCGQRFVVMKWIAKLDGAEAEEKTIAES